ncbi:MAG: inositol monophosphatase family protein [Candidatus Limnocylindrales bacterium]
MGSDVSARSTADPARFGSSPAYGAELELAIDLAHQAGRIQMERYERLERIQAKGPRDVVTEVDHLCEDLIMRAVRERYPNDHFYAEEIGEVAAVGPVKSGRVWIVDPLDGTVNYANGIPFFCVSIALAAEGRPVVGVVYDPSRDETFSGAADGPSLRNGEPIHVGDKELLEDLVVTLAVGGRGTVRKRRDALKSIRAHRSMGSASLTLAYVGCGRFDVYAQSAGLSAWDVAAAGLIAERAGATVSTLDGGPWFDLAYPAKKWSCLAASPRHHASMLAMLR